MTNDASRHFGDRAGETGGKSRFPAKIAATAMLACVTAMAAAGALEGDPAQNTRAPSAAADGADAVQLQEITVTARLRTESLQTVPVSVSALSGEQLERLGGGTTIQELTTLTPNLTIAPVSAGPGAANIGIRGVSFDDVEKSFDPAIGVVIDGVYMGTSTGQLVHAFDFESVEVLRGPQGTLFGRNTPGGVINIRRTTPTGEWGADVNMGGGNYGGFNYNAVINLPKVAGFLSTKLFFMDSQTGGYYYNATLNDHEGKETYRNFGATFLFDGLEGVDYRLTAERVQLYGTVDQSSVSTSSTDLICIEPFPFGAPANECNRNTRHDLYTTFSGGPNGYQYGSDMFTGEGHWRIGNITLTSVTGYQHENEYENDDIDASSIVFYQSSRPQRYHQFSQELRAAGRLSPDLDFVAGFYHFNSGYQLAASTLLGPGLSFPLPNLVTLQDTAQTSQSNAIFGDANWKFLPQWRLTVGGRYTWDHKTTETQLTDTPNVCYPSATCLLVPQLGASWSAFTPKASIDWQVTDQFMTYISFSEGYRSGGFNGRPTTVVSATQPYNPEKVNSFELGAKTEWLDRRLMINGAAFLTKYKDKQEQIIEASDTAPFEQTVVANAANATIKGVELEMKAVPAKGLTVNGSLGLLNAEYDHFYALACTTPDPTSTVTPTPGDPQPKCPLVPADLKTLTMTETPHATVNVGFDYTLNTGLGDWTLSPRYAYVSSYQTTIVAAVGNPYVNDPRGLRQPESTLNATLRWAHSYGASEAHVSLWGRNLLDNRGLGGGVLPVGGGGYSAAGVPAVDLWTFAYARPPLMFGIDAGYKYR